MHAVVSAAAAPGATVLAHTLHYAIVGGGALGVVALLAPRWLPSPSAPRDAHEARVQALRQALAAPYDATRLLEAGRPSYAGPRVGTPASLSERVLLPLAVVASAAAAGVHAAAGPAHFREATVFGLFFTAGALAQLAWAGGLALRPTPPLLVAGAVGNLAVVALWATTRTMGLPWGLLPQPEAIGPWDLASVAWELLVVGCCVAALRSGVPQTRLADAGRWHPGVRWFAVASVLGLVMLSLSGAGS
ncbi:hypothetical protein [Nocardioides flavescens]|uniref:Uncharacterized protein n=1 Tax=Nocardioides flavescens TaxID=2691959 RepID=A0A6L7EWG8_9ACTN|nr:hypothetical protein [Nocardioides flavescens]MXG89738.1 hypothetical protein [Nocardioides flavescens]